MDIIISRNELPWSTQDAMCNYVALLHRERTLECLSDSVTVLHTIRDLMLAGF